MIFTQTDLDDAYLIELELIEDERGFFARSFCRREFEQHGLDGTIMQCNVSYNRKKGTLRGMHYQAPPHEEAKMVSCLRGAMYDVIVDLRPDSATYRRWLAVELTAGNRRSIYIPKGFAHGFQTLEPDTEVLYMMSEFYHPTCRRGIRWNDPSLNIRWPITNPFLSEKDSSHPFLTP